MAVAAARAGKHLWVEKPVGVHASDASPVRDAVGVASVVGTVVVEAQSFLAAIAGGPATGPTLDHAVAAAQVVEAMVGSARTGRWVTLPGDS